MCAGAFGCSRTDPDGPIQEVPVPEVPIDELLQQAEALLEAGQYGDALSTLGDAEGTSDEEEYRIQKALAVAQAALGNVEASVTHTRVLLSLNHRRANNDINREIASPFFSDPTLLRQGVDYYERLKQDLPRTWWVYANLGTLAQRLGDSNGARSSRATASELQSRGIILIVVDTIRADHLGTYGYERPTSPNFDAWAAEGRLFERAHATSPWTLPSFGSIYTGYLPMRHGAGLFENQDEQSVCDENGVPWEPLDSSVPTLAETFQSWGYATGAVVSNPYLSNYYGGHRGFATYDYSATARTADRVVDRALEWIDTSTKKALQQNLWTASGSGR